MNKTTRPAGPLLKRALTLIEYNSSLHMLNEVVSDLFENS